MKQHLDQFKKLSITARLSLFVAAILLVTIGITINNTLTKQEKRAHAANTTAASACTLFVAKNGNNNNPGTETLPLLTIQKAANVAVAGDTVCVKAGTYNEKVTINNSGNAENWINFSADPETAQDTVIIDGTGISTPDDWDGLIVIKNSKFIKVSGFRVQNSNLSGIVAIGSANGGSRWSHITIENNHTYKTRSSGIQAYGGGDNLIVDGNEIERAADDGSYWSQECLSIAWDIDTVEVKNNYVHDGSMNGVGGGGEGIDLKDGISNAVVHHNHVRNVEQLGIYIDAFSRHNYNIEVYNNIVHEGKDWEHGMAAGAEQGGTLENVKFYNNIIYNCRNIGFWLIQDHNGSTIKNISVINNVFFNNGISKNSSAGGIWLMASFPGVSNIRVANNIVNDNYAYEIIVSGTIPGLVVENNLIYPFRNYSGETKGINYVEASPLFVNAAGADFHLQIGSPAIDASSSTDAPAFDFDGNTRPVGAAFDIGAYEYCAEAGCIIAPTPQPTNTPTPGIDSPPTVTITYPPNGTKIKRNTTINITASASDNIGVKRVEFRVNGSLKCTDATAPYTCSYRLGPSIGTIYTIQAKAYDSIEQTAIDSVQIVSSKN